MKIKTKHSTSIVAYKHTGEFHKLWRKGVVLNVSSNRYIIMNNKTLVEESNGKKWYTRNPAIYIFFKDRWFNIICMLKKTGIEYYCNLASPVIEDDGILKYIDYDIDIKVFPNKKLKLLDLAEYKKHKKDFGYSSDLNTIIHWELENLKDMIKAKADPFNEKFIKKWLSIYEEKYK